MSTKPGNKSKKEQARALIIHEGLNQKQAAAEVGVTEKTVGRWAREGRWTAEAKELRSDPAFNSLIDFVHWTEQHGPKQYQGIKALHRRYLLTLSGKAPAPAPDNASKAGRDAG